MCKREAVTRVLSGRWVTPGGEATVASWGDRTRADTVSRETEMKINEPGGTCVAAGFGRCSGSVLEAVFDTKSIFAARIADVFGELFAARIRNLRAMREVRAGSEEVQPFPD